MCALVPYLLGFDPTGLLVAVATDDTTSAWPCDPVSGSPAELADRMANASSEGWWLYEQIVLLAYRPVSTGLLAEAVEVFTAADCLIWEAWSVDAGNGMICPCLSCDDAPVPYNRSPSIAAVLSAEDTSRSGEQRRALRDRLEPIVTADATSVPHEGGEETGDLLECVLLGKGDPTPLDAVTFSTAVRFGDVYARAEAMARYGRVTADRLRHLLRHVPAGARANTACLLATAAALYPAPDPFLVVDALAIALKEATDATETERCQRLISHLYLPPVTDRQSNP